MHHLGLSEIINVRCLAHCLAHRNHSINVSKFISVPSAQITIYQVSWFKANILPHSLSLILYMESQPNNSGLALAVV